ncbi:MAG: 5-(carboxyamino)imidazole ribonucleotide synthase, partial [Halohasta sp.]
DATLYNVDSILDEPNAHMHWYGKKQVRPLRKMGHVTVTDPDNGDRDALIEHTESLRDGLTFVGESQ